MNNKQTRLDVLLEMSNSHVGKPRQANPLVVAQFDEHTQIGKCR
jgi:hypothetical protein